MHLGKLTHNRHIQLTNSYLDPCLCCKWHPVWFLYTCMWHN